MLAWIAVPLVSGSGSVKDILQKKTVTCADWAVSANYYIKLGEDRAIAALKAGSASPRLEARKGFLCRMLFVSKSGSAPAPRFGLLLPYDSLSRSAWPDLPMVQQNGVWFLVTETFRQNRARPFSDTVDAYFQEGRLRATPFRVPTSKEARLALSALFHSARWKAISWKPKPVNGIVPPYTMENRGFLRAQTKF